MLEKPPSRGAFFISIQNAYLHHSSFSAINNSACENKEHTKAKFRT
jgi:hypothetical protein